VTGISEGTGMPFAERPSHVFFQRFWSLLAMISDMLCFTLPAVFFVAMTAPEARCTILFGLLYSPFSPFAEIRRKLDFFHHLPHSFACLFM
jgi:hypothetical protein